jgi:hypothetical protein
LPPLPPPPAPLELTLCIRRKNDQVYTADEDAHVDRVQEQLGELPEATFERLESPDPLVKMDSLFFSGESNIVLRGAAEIDAPPELCAAHDMLKLSRAHQKTEALARAVKMENEHSFIFHYAQNFRIPRAHPREWVLRCIWKWRDERTLVVAYSSVDSVDFAVNPSWTRATNVVCNVYEKLPEGAQGTTKATWTQQMDMKMRLPKWFAKRAGPAQVEYLSKMRKQFDRSSDIDARSRLKIIEAAEKAQT